MQIVRTIVWVLLLAALLLFSALNWIPVEVKIWQGLVVETKIPALVVIAFLIGLVPMWLLHRATKWQLNRRIASLESAARANAMAQSPPPPVEQPPEPQPAAQPEAEEPPFAHPPIDEHKPLTS